MKEFIKEVKFKFLFSVILMFVVSLGTIYSIYIRSNIANLIIVKNKDVFKYIIILLVIIVVIENLNTVLKINNAKLIKLWNIKLSDDISNNICGMGYNKFKENTPGSYISWYTGDLPLVSAYVFSNSISVFNHTIIALSALFIMFYINIYIGILSLILILMIRYIGSIFGEKIGLAYRKYAVVNSKFNNILQDFLVGYDLLKNYNNLEFFKKNINKGQTELENQMYIIKKTSSFGNLVSQGTRKLFEGIMFAVTGYLVLENKISMGMLIVTPTILSIFLESTMEIFEIIVQYYGGGEIFKKLKTINHLEEYKFPELNNKIEFKNASFGYEDEKIFKNLNISFEKNKKYALIGDSGSGKSTLLKLILGRQKVNEGEILIDEENIGSKEIDFSSEIAYVSQENYMFNLNVFENITLGEKYTKESIDKVLKEVKVYDVINAKENGIETNINEFSGGEKQRIALARALIRNTPVIILDEATSALDQKTSIEIENILLSKGNKTIILISHHLTEEIKSKFDKIYLIDKNRNIREINI